MTNQSNLDRRFVSSYWVGTLLALLFVGSLYLLTMKGYNGAKEGITIHWEAVALCVWAFLVLAALCICAWNTERTAKAAERSAKAAEETAAIFAGRNVVLDHGENEESEVEIRA